MKAWAGALGLLLIACGGDDSQQPQGAGDGAGQNGMSMSSTGGGGGTTSTAGSTASGGSTASSTGGANGASQTVQCTSDEDCGLCRVSEQGQCCRCPFVASISECTDRADQASCGDCPAVECPTPGMPSCDERGQCVPYVAPPPGSRVETGSCESDADCIVCDAVVTGTIQCCMPCGMVTSMERCETNRALAGDQCERLPAGLGCPEGQTCSTPLTPACIDGKCGQAQ